MKSTICERVLQSNDLSFEAESIPSDSSGIHPNASRRRDENSVYILYQFYWEKYVMKLGFSFIVLLTVFFGFLNLLSGFSVKRI